jgi:hypothetical protein
MAAQRSPRERLDTVVRETPAAAAKSTWRSPRRILIARTAAPKRWSVIVRGWCWVLIPGLFVRVVRLPPM